MADNLTDKQRIFLEVLFDEVDKGVPQDDAMATAHKAAGYAETTHPRIILSQLREEINKRAEIELAMTLPTVIHKVKKVLKSEDEEMNSKAVLDAAAFISDRAGLIKKDQSTVTIKAEQGIIVMPPKKTED